ncbi:inorganic polyphosphate/ATP-NAD kinase, putative [Entamoeba invadens IP1]|uniref:Inorganic polyphosphate/ATP-NAD kinase, putative n=2 Tax=Entamoeba invadens TaxID=33085 RepID=A0A0A1TVD4_ENTIV|nr:inorganic polyphosphate/ATP-NAD kinase, putative [Entamoeba invadens IP1]ELP84327.1 inorganic polyphosphate/ATP-NAD kinase, putative [Entamoeba invadens IP1]BAN41544.1 inorganic polyphosphate/ATP-NAD kinase, putative [Entamoeba invadens]|eukprot:XP_004183673.1 inorganic polyphosphate/ATP-NAD kinase, putative [Entamoeba invadens IP1]
MEGTIKPSNIRAIFYIDPYNPKAKTVSEMFSLLQTTNEEDANVICVFGGDGTFLHAFHKYADRKIPFLGINCGNVGFLINSIEEVRGSVEIDRPVRCYTHPYLTATSIMGENTLPPVKAFNDVWIERNCGQCCWFEVSINGVVRIPKLTCDGCIICTQAGSTGYSRSVGMIPIPYGTPLIGLVPNNASFPHGIKPMFFPIGTSITIRNLQPYRRFTRAFYDGIEIGEVTQISVCVVQNGCTTAMTHDMESTDVFLDKTLSFFD